MISVSPEEALWWAAAHGRTITHVLVLAVVCAIALQLLLMRRRYRKHQARQLAISAGLGLRAFGHDPKRSLLQNAREAVVDATEEIGPFRRFRGRAIVRVLYSGERHSFQTTIFVHTLSSGDDPRDSSTTVACFVSPDLDLPPFDLSPAIRMPAVIEALGAVVAKAIRPLTGPTEPVVEFSGHPRFHELYSLRTGFAVSIRDVFAPSVLEFFERHPGWTIEALKGRILVCRENVAEPPERIADFLAEAEQVAHLLRKPASTGC